LHEGCSSQDHVFTWLAIYTDGIQFPECDGEACHVFGQIDLDRLESFALVPREGDYPNFVFLRTEDTTPIFFRRFQRSVLGADDAPWTEFCCIGFKKTLGDRVVKVYQFVGPDGSTLLTDNFQAL
jgi:hypothetical protein